jgi:hypothetical protein
MSAKDTGVLGPTEQSVILGQVSLVAVVGGAVAPREHFEFLIRIVAFADARNLLVNRLALVVARHQHAYGWLIRVILARLGARESKPQNDPHQILDHGNQQAKDDDELRQDGSHA